MMCDLRMSPLADDGAATEQQRLRPLLGPRHLGEHDAHHERLDHHARDALQAHDENCLWALLRRRSAKTKQTVCFKNYLLKKLWQRIQIENI
jgi:hypothetical protein